MITSKKSHEGYLLIDHRFSPGVPAELLAANPNAISTPAGTQLEIAVYTCSHCQTDVIKNPDRTRARAYCPNCDHYICDKCNAIRLIAGCKSYKAIIDEIEDEYGRNLNLGEI